MQFARISFGYFTGNLLEVQILLDLSFAPPICSKLAVKEGGKNIFRVKINLLQFCTPVLLDTLSLHDGDAKLHSFRMPFRTPIITVQWLP